MAVAWALLIVRVVAGLTLAAHGAQKLFGVFGGAGVAKHLRGFKAQGYWPAPLWAFLVIVGELGGGVLFALGLLTPLAAALGVGAMAMAILSVHWSRGFFNAVGGIEYPLLLLTMYAAIGIAGPGAYSLDAHHVVTYPLPVTRLQVFGILVLLALVVDIVGLLIKRSRTAARKAAAAAPVGASAAIPHATRDSSSREDGA